MRAAPALSLAMFAAVAGTATGQDPEPSGESPPPGLASLGAISASPFATSLFVTVECPSGGNDCAGEVVAVGAGGRRIDELPFGVPAGSSERLRLVFGRSLRERLRSTGRMRVTVTLTAPSATGIVTQTRSATVKAKRKKKPKKKRR